METAEQKLRGSDILKAVAIAGKHEIVNWTQNRQLKKTNNLNLLTFFPKGNRSYSSLIHLLNITKHNIKSNSTDYCCHYNLSFIHEPETKIK
jgi:hypothetical protein